MLQLSGGMLLLDNQADNFRLGNLYYHGYGVVKDRGKARNYYLAAADSNCTGAMVMMFYIHIYTGLDSEAYAWCKRAADMGNVGGLYRLGVCYAKGIGVEKEREKAIKYFELDAMKSSIYQYELGMAYMKGLEGLRMDMAEALKWLEMAATNGVLRAQYELGKRYTKGSNLKKNMAEALKWLEMAANNGELRAQVDLYKYYDGETMYDKALIYIQMAVDQKDKESYKILGKYYLCGYGVEMDFDKVLG